MSSNGTRDDSAPPARGAAEDLAILQEADAPIQRRAEDRLNRRRFAETVGRALAGWNQDRSLTVALYGPWGCGKTSIVNMALEWMEQECPDPKPAVLRFNPWEWSSQDALFRAFFDEVAAKLPEIGGPKLGDLWQTYAEQLQVYDTALGVVSDAVRDILAPVGRLVFIPFHILQGAVRTKKSHAVFSKMQLAERGRSTLHEARERLRNALVGLRQNRGAHRDGRRGRNLIVNIDDIDRLPPSQIVMIFQLIRANGDFPGMVYLLAFDREVVANVLNREYGIDGAAYLERIVQVPVEVPHSDSRAIQSSLENGMSAILARSTIGCEFNWTRWSQIYGRSLRVFFETLRHVRRYLDAFAFQCAVFSGHNDIMIDPVDLAVLEALRVFVPAIHAEISRNKELFCGIVSDPTNPIPEREKFEKVIALDPKRKEVVGNVLMGLFPIVAVAYELPERDLAELALAGHHCDGGRRVCEPDIFDHYFRMVIGYREIAVEERTIAEETITHYER